MTLIDRNAAIAELEKQFQGTTMTLGGQSFKMVQLGEAVEALRALPTVQPDPLGAVRKWLRHDGLCGIVGGYGYCTCGLDAALAALPKGVK